MSSSRSGFELKNPPKSITIPKSVSTKCATNPIYDGPIYESPMGEPFKALLGSTPSTPCTPSPDSPRYFDMPPSLPPPRKTSISHMQSGDQTVSSQPTQTLAIIREVEEAKSSFDKDIPPPVNDDYTIMKPLKSHSTPRQKPSPLVISNSLKEQVGEYVSMK